MGLLCITCDLDEIDCYHAVHGLPPPKGDQAHIIYNRALARVAAFLEDLHVPGTLFVVGKDIEASIQGVEVLRTLAGRGCETANHTMQHRYDFTLLGSEARADEIDGAAQVMERMLGVRPVGFRAQLISSCPDPGIPRCESGICCCRYWRQTCEFLPCRARCGHRVS